MTKILLGLNTARNPLSNYRNGVKYFLVFLQPILIVTSTIGPGIQLATIPKIFTTVGIPIKRGRLKFGFMNPSSSICSTGT